MASRNQYDRMGFTEFMGPESYWKSAVASVRPGEWEKGSRFKHRKVVLTFHLRTAGKQEYSGGLWAKQSILG